MIDFGLLVTMIIAMGLPAMVARWWPITSFGEPVSFLDVAIGPSFAGLAVGRLVAVGIDGPSSLGSLSDLLIIRSGVEFWPGVVAAAIWAAWSARRVDVSPIAYLADLTSLALVGYAGYEVTCVVRDGCFGPASPFGLQPTGTFTTMLPVGVVAAIVTGTAAIVLHRQQSTLRSAALVLSGLAVVAAVRSIGSIWLPHIGDGLTRQHWSSILVMVIAAAGLLVLSATTNRGHQTTAVDDESGTRA